MELELPFNEIRVLGALIEKEMSTPEYYPLTLNALVAACNQKNNRHPVVAMEEKTVVRAIENLRTKNLVIRLISVANRVPKYKHHLSETLGIATQELAVLCELLLRGPQTLGELRARTERLYEFSSNEELEKALEGLITREAGALILKLPRQPGQKESRLVHLLSGEPVIAESPSETRLEATTVAVQSENDRLANLESKVDQLEKELAGLQREFAEFKRQFE